MRSVLFVFISLFSTGLFAQTKPGTTAACYKEWYTLFKERGAKPIPDGMQDVIITLRNGDYANCFLGNIEVANGKLASKLQIQKMDGSYEEFDRKVSTNYQNADGVLKEEIRDISNGMSTPLTLTDGEVIRLFFYKFLADKPKAYKKAPSPAALLKN